MSITSNINPLLYSPIVQFHFEVNKFIQLKTTEEQGEAICKLREFYNKTFPEGSTLLVDTVKTRLLSLKVKQLDASMSDTKAWQLLRLFKLMQEGRMSLDTGLELDDEGRVKLLLRLPELMSDDMTIEDVLIPRDNTFRISGENYIALMHSTSQIEFSRWKRHRRKIEEQEKKGLSIRGNNSPQMAAKGNAEAKTKDAVAAQPANGNATASQTFSICCLYFTTRLKRLLNFRS